MQPISFIVSPFIGTNSRIEASQYFVVASLSGVSVCELIMSVTCYTYTHTR